MPVSASRSASWRASRNRRAFSIAGAARSASCSRRCSSSAAEPVTALAAVDGQEAEPPGAVGERHAQPAVDPRLVVVGRRLGGRSSSAVAERELDRTVLLAPAPARHVERQLDRLGRQPGGGEDRRPVLRLQRDQGGVGSGQPPCGLERPLEHLVEIDRLGDLVEERPPAPLLLGLPGRVGQVARELVEAGLEPRGQRRRPARLRASAHAARRSRRTRTAAARRTPRRRR